ncbi:pre-mRNA-splicing factor [Histoplasma capsulatum G186AR]|uniref:Pre-mRNA-splicing factor 18 n=2 Tax=Ajellomyces capsulatus TaxID=5037 RepID=C0NEB1_AJECG|nr:pre-mRNA-splicing factor [Histoplasma capsulatum G186AR]EEH09582.1 pre-mRNA-splicing factor [Histoplasma capsulatum G186AR]KAG5289001.1 pre-mRNA-splicing factor [Histoplasma capsulatum]QSS73407.1 pre-mRNA-splicing factor [Histoplasma capsulatum G186AR]
MDFASLMAKEISKAKAPEISTATSDSKKPYVKRSDTEAARLAAYHAEQEELRKEREQRAERKRKFEQEQSERNRARDEKRRQLAEESRRKKEAEAVAKERERRRRLGLPEVPAGSPNDSMQGSPLVDDEEDLGEDEVIDKLRAAGEPAILFGESHKGRVKRYRRLLQRSLTPQQQMLERPIATTLVLVPEAEMRVPPKLPTDEEGRRFLFRQLASYFTMIFKEWEIALSKRDDDVKNSYQGKQAYNAMVQSRENIRPLFRRFENGDLEESILEPVVEIVRSAQDRRYVDANDGYLRLSIGKAAWPIGVTMVGIHERSAREKLHQSDKSQAHIMSDEITRKFLQSIKRCLTFAQVRWPPDDQLQLMG